MPTESIRVSGLIPATPKQIYDAWLDPQAHSKFTKGKATVEPYVGGKFTAWDQYIRGENIELEPGKRIVQTWKTTDFPKGAPASRLEVTFVARKGIGTEITFVQTEIPEGQGQKYAVGWLDHYVTPMRRYFASLAAKKEAAKVKAVAQKDAAAAAKAAGTPPPAAPVKASKPAAKAKAPKKAAKKAPVKKPAKKPAKKAAAKKPAKKPAKKAAAKKPAKKPAKKAAKSKSKKRR
jgi:uncharacterized protein YndB with AHSA1/START domain